jgi:hypothetical protein
MQYGRVHDDHVAWSAGHFFEPDNVTADRRIDIDQPA